MEKEFKAYCFSSPTGNTKSKMIYNCKVIDNTCYKWLNNVGVWDFYTNNSKDKFFQYFTIINLYYEIY